jgi:2-polyprenyl-6-methoxyphenol hydroxylase-like FAD-dependent oxidoreductase
MMGQGGCLAMEDAVVLAEELVVHSDLNEALDSYVLRRHPRVRWVQDQSRRLGEAFRMPSAERDAALRARGKEMFYERYAPLIPEP